MADGLLFDPLWAGTAATMMSVPIGILSLDSLRWNVRIQGRATEWNVVRRLTEDYYGGRPTGTLYSLVPDIALYAPFASRNERLLRRCLKARSLESGRYEFGCSTALKWISTVGRFASVASVDKEIPLRRFLQTYHLGVVREGSIAAPFVISLFAENRLDESQVANAVSGMALVDLAARYNSIARQQRQGIYIDVVGVQHPFGPVVRPPPGWKRPGLDLADVLRRDMRLRQSDRVRAERRLRLVASRVHDRQQPPK